MVKLAKWDINDMSKRSDQTRTHRLNADEELSPA